MRWGRNRLRTLGLALAIALCLAGGLWAGRHTVWRPTPLPMGGGAMRAWRAALPDALQPLAAELGAAVASIPVYLPADLPLPEDRWSAFFDAGADRFGLTLVAVDRPVPPNDPTLRRTPDRWVAHIAGGPPGSMLLWPPRAQGQAAPVDLGRGLTGHQRWCDGRRDGCPVTVLTWRVGGWVFWVWTGSAEAEARAAVQAAARQVVSRLPAFLNPVRAESAGQMAVRLEGGRQETGIVWFHPEADLFIGHRLQAEAALRMAAALEQVD